MAAGSTLDSMDPHIPLDENLATELDAVARNFKRSVKFLVAGRGGVGKSTMINNLLDLKSGETGAKVSEQLTGKATTESTREYEGSRSYGRNNITVIAYDTPGFQDAAIPDSQVIADLVHQTGTEVDVFLYCASLETRVSQEDKRIFTLLTKAFSKKLWKQAIVVLTFANTDRVTRSSHKKLVNAYKEVIHGYLKEMKVPKEDVDNIPFCIAGWTDPQLTWEGSECSNWQDRVYLKILEKTDPEVTLALLKLRWGLTSKDVAAIVGGAALGCVTGAAVIGTIGGVLGTFLGPLGTATGAIVGTVSGAIAGTLKGSPLGALAGHGLCGSQELQDILKAKWKLKKLKRK